MEKQGDANLFIALKGKENLGLPFFKNPCVTSLNAYTLFATLQISPESFFSRKPSLRVFPKSLV